MNSLGASAGGDPPPNKETLRRAAQVRIDVLTGSIQGLGFGLVLGAGGWPLFRRTVLRSKMQFLHRKYHVFATLVVGAFGSFIGSLASCRNSLEVQLAGLESEHTRGQRRMDDAFMRRRQALQQRPSSVGAALDGGGAGGVASSSSSGSGEQEPVVLDAGSGFPNPFGQPPQPPQSGPEQPRASRWF